MKTFESVNGLAMISDGILNWRYEGLYADDSGVRLCTITVGGIAEMYICNYNIEDDILSIANMASSSFDVLKYKLRNIQEASFIVESFAKGMGHSFEGTIYEIT